jgi:chorismate synthase
MADMCMYAMPCITHYRILQVDRIDAIRKTGNSIGGVVECVARNVPVRYACSRL